MKIICISGKAEHGKDTLANTLTDKLTKDGKKVLTAHFGDLVKYICAAYFKWNGKKDEEGRRMLQHVGTDVIRNQTPDFWVNFVADVLGYFNGCWDYILIPDCRFPNEYEVLKKRGFDTTLIRITRPNYRSHLTDEQMFHPSETALDNYTGFDYCVVNTDFESLENQAVNILNQLNVTNVN